MPNTIITKIIAKDEATQVFNKLGESMRNNVAIGTLMGNTISGAVDIAKKAVGGLINSFQDAADIQSANIGTAGDFARLTGLSFTEASEQLDDFTARMAVVAGTLPGNTQLYTDLGKGITDNLIPAFKDASGAFDEISFNSTLDDITKSAGIRAANAGLQAKDAALAVSKALSGKSISELSQLQFFEQSPAALAFLESEAKKIGKDLKDMTDAQRAEVVRKALAVPDEVINAASNSVNGLIEGFKTTLFDPTVGLFGLMRDLDLNTDGNQNALANIQNVLKKIFGSDGVIAKSGTILSSLGISIDPMKMFADGLGKVGLWLDGVNSWLGNFAFIAEDTRGFDPKKTFSNMGAEIGKWFAGLYNKLIVGLNGINWGQAGYMLGDVIAEGINLLGSYIRNIDFTNVAQLFLQIVGGVGMALWGVVTNIEWGTIGIILLKAGAVALAAAGVVMATAIFGLGTAGVAAVGGLMLALVAGFGNVRDFFKNNQGRVIEAISELLNKVADFFRNVFKGGGAIGGNGKRGDAVRNRATGLDQMGLFGAISRERKAMPNGSNLVVANDSELILPRSSQVGLLNALNSKRSSVGLTVGSIIINAGANSNPKQLAQAVMREIDIAFRSSQQQQLAPNY